MNLSELKTDCVYFSPFQPCDVHKRTGGKCIDCSTYIKYSKRILVIKTAAAGDVLRTTPLLTAYRTLYPDCLVTWLTSFPDLIEKDAFTDVLEFNHLNILRLVNSSFDIAVNLEKDISCGIVLKQVTASEKYGFTYSNNLLIPINQLAVHKYLTGIDDLYSKNNQKSYIEEVFELCNLSYTNEEILVPVKQTYTDKWRLRLRENSPAKPVVLINTGAGSRWPTRIWPLEYFVDLINRLKTDYTVVIAGGPEEHEKNLLIMDRTGVCYPGVRSLDEFIGIVSAADLVITSVTMTLHIAIGLKKKIVLFNNIFNKAEFNLGGLGEIIEPSSGCECYYGNSCSRERPCIYDISVDLVIDRLKKLL